MAQQTSTTKGSNPAPNFALLMNRIQVSLDSGSSSAPFLKQHRAAAAAKSSTTTAKPAGGGAGGGGGAGTFSSLQSSSSSFSSSTAKTLLNKRSGHTQAIDHAARIAAEEAEFAEDRASDANAGIGFARPRKDDSHSLSGQNMAARDRDTKMLRGRLLGGRGRRQDRDDQGVNGKRRAGGRFGGRGESSEDDEPGRSGLGRSKKIKKRTHSEVGSEEEIDDDPGKDGEEEGDHQRRETQPAGSQDTAANKNACDNRDGDNVNGGALRENNHDHMQRGASAGVEKAIRIGEEGMEQASEAKAKRKKKKKKKTKHTAEV